MRVAVFSIIIIFQFYQGPTLNLNDLKMAQGKWSGTLTYLDYTNNKKYSIPVNLIVTKEFRLNGLVIRYDYPKEKQENFADTCLIGSDGRSFNSERMISLSKKTSVTEFSTEIEGYDGNDHKAALIRHEYRISKQRLIIRKLIRFEGTTDLIFRNEYIVDR